MIMSTGGSDVTTQRPFGDPDTSATRDDPGTTATRGDREEVTVRPARADDAPVLTVLSAELGYPAERAQIERRLRGVLASGDDAVFVAVTEGAGVVGFVHALEKRLIVNEPFVELGGLIVAAGARRRGAARLLIEAVERWATARGVDLLRVRTRKEREVADVAYRRCGFELEKEQRVFTKRLV
jgi:GNAT superfamily N-acetyltransferase